MITLTLLHPLQSTPVQRWSFEGNSVIQVGRGPENLVVVYSAVVCDRHLELRRNGLLWEVKNFGVSGTYVNGKRVDQAVLTDGAIIRLGRSGPNLQVDLFIDSNNSTPASLLTEDQDHSQAQHSEPVVSEEVVADTAQSPEPASQLPAIAKQELDRLAEFFTPQPKQQSPQTCTHPRATPGARFCIDCGAPLFKNNHSG